MSNLAETYIPFDVGPGATATPARWRSMSRTFERNGIIPGYASQFSGVNANSVVTVQPGAVWIDGFYAETTVAHTASNAGLGTGLLVLRADPTARTIGFVYLPSATQGAVLPTQSHTGIYEIPLYYITGINSMIDVRQFATATDDHYRPPASNGPYNNSNYCARGRMYRKNPYNTSTTVYNYGFDTVSYGAAFFSGYQFVCPYSDDYLVCSSAGFVASAVNQWMHHWIMRSGQAMAFHECDSPGPLYTLSQMSDIIPCKAGDTIYIAHQTSITGRPGLVGPDRAYMAVRALSR